MSHRYQAYTCPQLAQEAQAVSTRAASLSGVQDSKRIGSDARIRSLADVIRKTQGALTETVTIGPAKYNELYEKFGNLNKLLGWGHARVIENLVVRKPNCRTFPVTFTRAFSYCGPVTL